MPLPLVSMIERRPALRLRLVAGLLELRHVEPADHAAPWLACAGPQRVVLVVAEIEVVRREAGRDQRPLVALRIVHREMTRRFLQRRDLRGRMIAALLAIGRVRVRADARGKPDAALLVDHRVVVAGVAVPDRLFGPVGRRPERQTGRGRRLRIAIRMFDHARRVRDRIEPRHVVGALLRRPVDPAVGIDGRLAFVGRHRVMQVMLRRRPVPRRDHDVALDALRALRLG